MAEWVFVVSVAAVVYAYFGYAAVLRLVVSLKPRRRLEATPHPEEPPSVSLIVPVHNEHRNIDAKLQNTRALQYAAGRLEVLFVSDGSTDGTNEAIASASSGPIRLIVLPERGGKASALNAGLSSARNDILVFSDASIMLEPDALMQIVQPFADPSIGCVSGEDAITQSGGEGLYGRYELYLRRLESNLHSIVGASGSLYAQRRTLCEPFVAGLAPDFYSVLRTVELGFRAVAEPTARGTMAAVSDPREEFSRKVRTILRGITTLATHAHLLNPMRFGWFAFELFSHKLMRWLVPFFLFCLLLSNLVLAIGSPWFALLLAAQLAFYGLAALSLLGPESAVTSMPVKVTAYFTAVNLATLSAWLKYAMGVRQELWSPSRR
jgi:cellulose synthase/poly-beta-1,6-N-acetylglucosamine synthase-like glycosyltransferase